MKPRTVRRRLLLTIAVLVLVIAAAFFAGHWKNDLTVAAVQVTGNRIVATGEILSLAAIPPEEKLFAADLYGIRKRILRNYFIKDVEVSRNAPNTISIGIVEREPVVALVAEQMYYLDAEGVVLPPVQSPGIFDLPVITGKNSDVRMGKMTTDRNLLEALSIVFAAKQVDDDLYRQISEIHVAGEGDIILYTAESGVPVIFGHGGIGEKLVKFDGFWKSIVAHYGMQELKYIDLRFHDQVVVRWSKDSEANSHASHS